MTSLVVVKWVLRVQRVVQLRSAFFTALFSSLAQFTISSLQILLIVLTDLCSRDVPVLESLGVSPISPVRRQYFLAGWLNDIKVLHLPDVPVPHTIEVDIAHV